ncbi:hypothetical protein ACJMK2_019787 [Sinanodonta woodiana]|uniref:Rho GTPase-activating protein 5 n=1 Tax=Sinanodonta woodiana TaxID=1069815 RepID=A0ABD3TZ83_SINWO
MAKKPEGRTFNVSVIGLSGTEKEKGLNGIGKSCLCNRFIHQVADKYHTEHISILSLSDFGGRVINNNHFLYWGDVTKTDDGTNFTFHVIEQTEFVDDVSFMPFKTGSNEPYQKRCVATKVQSAEKLMYICKDQLGMETDGTYEQKVMPDGKLNIDGFVCCFDVSTVKQRSLEKQVEFTAMILNNAMKAKKPIVLATTKSDEMDERYFKEAEKLVNRKEFKGSIPLVETAAHDNVNVDSAFLTLAYMMDKTKPRTKIIPFTEAMSQRKEILEVASEAFSNLLRQRIVDSKTTLPSAKKKLEKEPDYQHYVDLFGSDKARKVIKQHTVALREEQIRKREIHFVKVLPDVLQVFLPDLETVGDRSWTSCQNIIRQDEDFNDYFVEVCEAGMSWKYTDFVDDYQETRLPFDFLSSSEAENGFRNHVNALQAARRKEELKEEFRKLLEKHIDIPGAPLSDTYTHFVGKECYTGLAEHERQQVYDEHQRELRYNTKHEFQELLWERPEVFRSLNLNQCLTEDDLNVIYNSLNDDQRFRKLYRLEDDRKVMLLNHVVFLDKSSVDRCFFHTPDPEECLCTECQVHTLLEREGKILPQIPQNPRLAPPDLVDSFVDNSTQLNLVLLGREGLSTELYKEIRNLCEDDEYRTGSRVYSLDYRPIEGDVSQEQNALAAADFKPHGCLCVYSSQESLDYVQSSLSTTLRSDLARDEGKTLEGLPIAVILAYNPSYTQRELHYLREHGKQLASSLHGEFVDIPAEDLAEKRKFYPEQIEQALKAVIKGPSVGTGSEILEDTEPDLRILMCMMCGDPFSMEMPIRPFLNDDTFTMVIDSTEEQCVFTLDVFLEYPKQKVEITVTSYHGGYMLRNRGELYHGYILVYSPQRKASYSTMRAFAEVLIPAPMLLIPFVKRDANLNECNQYLAAGKELAQCVHGRIMEATASFQHKTALQVYGPFLKEIWERRDGDDSEGMYFDEPSPPPAYDRMIGRPPAPLPNYNTNKSSTSNSQSTEDSEPLYDQPIPYHHPSDSERASSPSPPPVPLSAPPPDSDLYSSLREGDQLVKPSMLKNRQGSIVAWAINEPKRQMKSSTFPCTNQDTSSQAVVESTPPSSQEAGSEMIWSENSMYSSQSPLRAAVRPSKSKHKPHPLKLVQNSPFQRYSLVAKGPVQAPLALPEHIEIADYGTVKDALEGPSIDGDYASVDDALPEGKLHRIKSTQRKKEKAGVTDSEDSEFSSLERDKNKSDLYRKVNRKPTPHKKKHKHRTGSQDERPIISHPFNERHLNIADHQGEKARSNSPSEDSGGGTGDELQGQKPKQRRSFKRETKTPGSPNTSGTFSPSMSDSENIISPSGRGFEEYDNTGPKEYGTLHKFGSQSGGGAEDSSIDLNDSGNWGTWLKKKAGKDAVRNKEKKAKEEERKRIKEDEKKQKGQQKLQKKVKKKDGKGGQSETGNYLADYTMSQNNPSVPEFIEKCIDFIETEGLCAEGIYRIPGNKAQVDLLTGKFNEDSNVDISTLEIQVNAVATVLKAFFNDLSDPLVPVALYDELIEASGVSDKSSRLLALRGVFRKMHPLNFEVLKYLITHLNKVGKHSQENSMDSKNLARCWWPTLIRMNFDTFEKMAMYSRIPEEILQTLIEQCGFFFHGENEI